MRETEPEVDQADLKAVERIILEIQMEPDWDPSSIKPEQKIRLVRLFSAALNDGLLPDNEDAKYQWVRNELIDLKSEHADRVRMSTMPPGRGSVARS